MRALLFLAETIVMLVIELVATILVYTALNIYSLDFFGKLVRLAASVLDMMKIVVDRVFGESANAVYASVFGEFGPKAVLLLLIGLVVAAILRALVGVFRLTRE